MLMEVHEWGVKLEQTTSYFYGRPIQGNRGPTKI